LPANAGRKANTPVSTPSLRRLSGCCQLPVFDASEKEDRIQKTGNRRVSKSRRQNPAVGFACMAAQMEASKTGSFQEKRHFRESADLGL
jgi:hypothetical protein